MTERAQAQTRTIEFDIAARGRDDAIPVVVSSDAVVEVSDGPEVLVHSADAVDLMRAPLPIIATHRGGQVNVGLVDSLQVVGGQLRGLARFGSRQEAAEYRDDVLNGIIRSVSVGYARVQAKFRGDGVLVTSRWMPTHVALVAEPADVRAGFYRERDQAALPAFDLQAADPAPQVSQPAAPPAAPPGVATMATENQVAGESADTSAHRALPAQPNGTTGNRALEMETNRKRGIENLCKAIGIDDGIREGVFIDLPPRLATKPFFGVLNWATVWYSPRRLQSAEAIDDIAQVLAAYALRGILKGPRGEAAA